MQGNKGSLSSGSAHNDTLVKIVRPPQAWASNSYQSAPVVEVNIFAVRVGFTMLSAGKSVANWATWPEYAIQLQQ